MKSEEIITLGKKLNKEIAKILGVKEQKIVFDTTSMHAVRTHGRCVRNAHSKIITIKISNTLVKDKDIKEVLLHELCHAYAPWGAHHGPEWKAIAQKVGLKYKVKIERCSNREHTNTLEPIAYIVCPVCGGKTSIYRKSKQYKNYKTYYCCKCGKGTAGKLQLIENKTK